MPRSDPRFAQDDETRAVDEHNTESTRKWAIAHGYDPATGEEGELMPRRLATIFGEDEIRGRPVHEWFSLFAQAPESEILRPARDTLGCKRIERKPVMPDYSRMHQENARVRRMMELTGKRTA